MNGSSRKGGKNAEAPSPPGAAFLDWLGARLSGLLPEQALASLRQEIEQRLLNPSSPIAPLEAGDQDRPPPPPDHSREIASMAPPELFEILRNLSREYAESGTDYNLASGRLWAADPRRAQYTPFLFCSFEELKVQAPQLMASPGFIEELIALRRDMELCRLYVGLRRIDRRQQRDLQAFKRKGLLIICSSGSAQVVAPARGMPLRDFIAKLGVDASRWRGSYEQLLSANADLAGRYGDGDSGPGAAGETQSGLGDIKLAAGQRINVGGTVLVYEAERRELEYRLEVSRLLLEAQSQRAARRGRLSAKAKRALSALTDNLGREWQRLFCGAPSGRDAGSLCKVDLSLGAPSAAEGSLAEEMFKKLGEIRPARRSLEKFLDAAAAELNNLADAWEPKELPSKELEGVEKEAAEGDLNAPAFEALCRGWEERFSRFEIENSPLSEFMSILSEAWGQIGAASQINDRQKQALYFRLEECAGETLLVQLNEALRRVSSFEFDVHGAIGAVWAGAGHWSDLKPFFHLRHAELQRRFGNWAAAPGLAGRLIELAQRYRLAALEYALEPYRAETGRLVRELESRYLLLCRGGPLKELALKLKSSIPIVELARGLFELRRTEWPNAAHYALLSEANHSFRDICEASAVAKAARRLILPARSVVHCGTSSLGLKLQIRFLREMAMQHELLLLKSAQAAWGGSLASGAKSLSVDELGLLSEQKNGLEAAIKECESRLELVLAACFLGSIARRQHWLMHDAVLGGGQPVSAAESLERDLSAYLNAVCGKAKDNFPLSRLLRRLTLYFNIAEAQGALLYGAALWLCGLGKEAAQLLERSLRISGGVLSKQQFLSLQQRASLFELRVMAYRLLTRAYLLGDEIKVLTEKAAAQGRESVDAGDLNKIESCANEISRTCLQAGAEVEYGGTGGLQSEAQRDKRQNLRDSGYAAECRAEAHLLKADLFALAGVFERQHAELQSYAAAILSLPPEDEDLFLRAEIKVRIDEDSGLMQDAPDWESENVYAVLSKASLARLVERYEGTARAAKERFWGVLLQMADSAFQFEDERRALQALLCHRQLAQALRAARVISPDFMAFEQIIDAKTRYAFGALSGKQGPVISALGLLQRAGARFKASVNGAAEGKKPTAGLVYERRRDFDRVGRWYRAHYGRQLVAAVVFGEEMRLRLHLAHSQTSLAQAGEISRMRSRMWKSSQRKIAQLVKWKRRFRGKDKAGHQEAQPFDALCILAFEREIEALQGSCAVLMLYEAAAYLGASYAPGAKEVLTELRSRFGRILPWVEELCGSLEREGKDSMLQAVQAAANKFSLPEFKRSSQTALLFAFALAGASGREPGEQLGGVHLSAPAALTLSRLNNTPRLSAGQCFGEILLGLRCAAGMARVKEAFGPLRLLGEMDHAQAEAARSGGGSPLLELAYVRNYLADRFSRHLDAELLNVRLRAGLRAGRL